jgi:DNA (cytosine-5)-methyltransferase 1
MKLLDLFCGAGGAAMGYYRAGFNEIVGVDNRPMPRYPFTFVLADALEYVREHGHEFDAIHASPPCQEYSMSAQQWRQAGKSYPDLVQDTRDLLIASGKHYVIENVRGAPLLNPIVLNGPFFNMRLRRTRLFETSFHVPFTLIPPDEKSRLRMGGPTQEGDVVVPVGHFSNAPYARRVMGIDWMTQGELAQAIPPAYAEYIGRFLIEAITRSPARDTLRTMGDRLARKLMSLTWTT